MSTFEEFLSARLARIQEAGLLRSLRTLQSAQGPEVIVEGRRLHNFSSNDYLGLAADKRLRAAAGRALDESGSGTGASRLVCGNHAPDVVRLGAGYDLGHGGHADDLIAGGAGDDEGIGGKGDDDVCRTEKEAASCES